METVLPCFAERRVASYFLVAERFVFLGSGFRVIFLSCVASAALSSAGQCLCSRLCPPPFADARHPWLDAGLWWVLWPMKMCSLHVHESL